jgi:hypothetical protein
MIVLAAGLRAAGRATGILVYAWSPLALVEFYGSGHVDAAGVGLLAAAIGLWLLRRRFGAGAMFAAALLTKWILLPVAAVGARRCGTAAAIGGLLAAGILAAPYLRSGARAAESLREYQANWSFGGALHRALHVDAWAAAPRRIAHGEFEKLLDEGRANEKSFGRAVAAAAVCAAFAVQAARGPSLAASASLALFVFLLVQPTLHPWYATWLLPLLAVRIRRSALVWTAILPLTYETVARMRASGTWIEHGGTAAAVTTIVLVLLLQEARAPARGAADDSVADPRGAGHATTAS